MLITEKRKMSNIIPQLISSPSYFACLRPCPSSVVSVTRGGFPTVEVSVIVLIPHGRYTVSCMRLTPLPFPWTLHTVKFCLPPGLTDCKVLSYLAATFIQSAFHTVPRVGSAGEELTYKRRPYDLNPHITGLPVLTVMLVIRKSSVFPILQVL